MKFRLRQRTGSATAYDTTMGASVDANGFTSFPLRGGANRYFVGSGGSDSNTGLSHAQRFATLDKARSVFTAGQGDQILIAEGTTLAETLPQGGDARGWLASYSGFSALYPTLFSSYDPADPPTGSGTGEAKIGMGHQRSARPILSALLTAGLGSGTWGNIAVKGLVFDSGKTESKSLSGLGVMSNIIFENCICPYTGFSFADGGDGVAAPTASHIIIRNCSNYGVYVHSSAFVQNTYLDGIDGVTYEDNVNYHAGWEIGGGVTRDTVPTSGGPSIYKHPVYIQANCNNIIVRRNLIMDGSADAGIIRGDNATVYENVSIHCPSGTGLGPGNTAEFGAYPSGVHQQVHHNLSLAAIDLSSTEPRGGGYTTGNMASGSRVHHNLLIYNAATPNINDYAFQTTGGSVYGLGSRPTSVLFDYNVIYHWSTGHSVYSEFGTPITNTYANNIWDEATSGSNTNIGSVSFPNAYTEAALYTAAGVTDYATLVSLAIAAPEQHYQRTIRTLAFAGYGVTG